MVHPLFPRVVVYLWKAAPGEYEIAVKVKKDYSTSWTTVVREKVSTASKARGVAHLLGTAWEKRVNAPGKYELEHGQPARRGPRDHGNAGRFARARKATVPPRLKSTGETFDIRTRSSHWNCRVCKKTLPPQMAVAVFEPHAGGWRIKGWECMHHEEERRARSRRTRAR